MSGAEPPALPPAATSDDDGATPPPAPRRWLLGAGVTSWFVALAALVTWPTLRDPAGVLIGHPQTSVGCHVWVLWWARHHLGPLTSDLLFYPHGADVFRLYGSDLLSPLLLAGLPLPLPLLYNLWAIALLIAGGLGAYLLCRDRGAGVGGALVGGTVFASAPFFQHELLNGTTEILAAAALPWFALATLRLVERPSAWAGAASGLTFGAAVLASAYNLFFCAIVGLVVVVHFGVTRGERLLTRARLWAGAVAAAVAGGAAFPLALLHTRHGATALYARREQWHTTGLPLPDSFADLLAWVDPREADIPVRMVYPDGWVFEYWTSSTVYLGLVALGLAAYGLARRRGDGLFALLAVVGVLLACGPYLRIGGEVMTIGGQPLGMPALAVARVFPPFVITALHAYRYAALVVLGLSVLVGTALRGRWAALWIAPLLVDAVLLSPLPFPAAHFRPPDSEVLDTLAGLPDGGVLMAPFEREDLGDLSAMLLAQTAHGKPIQDGGIHRRAGADATRLFDQNLIVSDLSRVGGAHIPGATETAWAMAQLRAVGYRYVLCRADAPQVSAWLTGTLGPSEAADDRWILWQLAPYGEDDAD